MGLEEEIEKLLREKKAQLLSSDEKLSEHFAEQKRRFAALRSLLERAVAAIDPQHVVADFHDGMAKIKIGQKNERDYFKSAIEWEIQPDFEFLRGPTSTVMGIQGSPGFRVDEKVITDYPDYDIAENVKKFSGEADVMKYIVELMTDHVARYQYSAELRSRHSDKK